MKKLALAMVFILIMALFIAFNYLIWDRESREKAMSDLQNTNASNNASISAQNREIKSLEEDNGILQARIDQLETGEKQAQQSRDQALTERDQATLTINEKITMLNTLKRLLDPKTLETPVRQWADALDSGKFDVAYELEYGSLDLQKRPMSLTEYSDGLKKTLKRISFKSSALDAEKGSDTGDIYLAVTLDVTLVDNADMTVSKFQSGQNVRYFKLLYNAKMKVFIISGISSSESP
jgi:cell division protein FtsB